MRQGRGGARRGDVLLRTDGEGGGGGSGATGASGRPIGQCGLATRSRGDGLLSRWHKLAEQELSLLQDEMHRFLPGLSALSPTTLSRAARDGEREFFDSVTGSDEHGDIKTDGSTAAKSPTPDKAGNSYSSYSFSYSAVLDKEGQRVVASTKRRRYEDSSGRLKATHEREVDNGAKKLTSTWMRPSAQEERPQCKTTVEGCRSEEEFEQCWSQTAFADDQRGKAVERRDSLGYGSQPQTPAQQPGDGSQGFGPDVAAAEAVAEKATSALGDGVTQEAKAKSRADAIAEGSRRQEEETTLPM